jgi:hypothetical protein
MSRQSSWRPKVNEEGSSMSHSIENWTGDLHSSYKICQYKAGRAFDQWQKMQLYSQGIFVLFSTVPQVKQRGRYSKSTSTVLCWLCHCCIILHANNLSCDWGQISPNITLLLRPKQAEWIWRGRRTVDQWWIEQYEPQPMIFEDADPCIGKIQSFYAGDWRNSFL